MANTGYKHWRTLEEYDLDTGIATGKTKPNVEQDADYVAPVYDINACPLPPPPPPNLAWRGIAPYCEQENNNNTGFTAYATLEEYNADTGVATGNTKPNSSSDPDYVSTVYTPEACELPDTEFPVLIKPLTSSESYNNFMVYWEFTDNVKVNSQTLYVRPLGAPEFISKQLTADATADYIGSLSEGTTYEVYIRACDLAGNCEDSPLLRVTTAVRLTQVTLTRSYKSFDPCNGSSGTYYLNGSSIGTATMLYNTADGSSTAPPAWYSDQWYYRYWTGSAWQGKETPCSTGGFK